MASPARFSGFGERRELAEHARDLGNHAHFGLHAAHAFERRDETRHGTVESARRRVSRRALRGEARPARRLLRDRDAPHVVKAGDRVTLDNGIINVQVLDITGSDMRCLVIDGGKVGSRRHVNLPGVRVNLPSITEKDASDIKFGLENDFDFIALSFVRGPEDVIECRKLIEAAGRETRIFSKIENHEGVENLRPS